MATERRGGSKAMAAALMLLTTAAAAQSAIDKIKTLQTAQTDSATQDAGGAAASSQERLTSAFHDALSQDSDLAALGGECADIPADVDRLDWQNKVMLSVQANDSQELAVVANCSPLGASPEEALIPADFFRRKGFALVYLGGGVPPPGAFATLIDADAYKAISDPLADPETTLQKVVVTKGDILLAFNAAEKPMIPQLIAANEVRLKRDEEAAAAQRVKKLEKEMGKIGASLSNQ